MNIKRTTFRITGLTPVLIKKMLNEDLDKPPGAQQENAKRTPADEAERSCHRLPDGQVALAAEGFMRGLVLASSGFKFGKRAANAIIKGAVMVTADMVGLVDPSNGRHPIKEYVIDSRPIVNQKTKGRSLCHRPRIEKWSVDLPLDIDLDFIPESKPGAVSDNPKENHVLIPLFKRAGIISGAGSFRPQKGGHFGKYDVELV